MTLAVTAFRGWRMALGGGSDYTRIAATALTFLGNATADLVRIAV